VDYIDFHLKTFTGFTRFLALFDLFICDMPLLLMKKYFNHFISNHLSILKKLTKRRYNFRDHSLSWDFNLNLILRNTKIIFFNSGIKYTVPQVDS